MPAASTWMPMPSYDIQPLVGFSHFPFPEVILVYQRCPIFFMPFCLFPRKFGSLEKSWTKEVVQK
jgi:hypothetical protein